MAPRAAFVRKAPGSLFCALKIHIKSILAASLVLFLLDSVSPLFGRPWGFTPGMWLKMREPKVDAGKGGKSAAFRTGSSPPQHPA